MDADVPQMGTDIQVKNPPDLVLKEGLSADYTD
jgi:hypothetical protein